MWVACSRLSTRRMSPHASCNIAFTPPSDARTLRFTRDYANECKAFRNCPYLKRKEVLHIENAIRGRQSQQSKHSVGAAGKGYDIATYCSTHKVDGIRTPQLGWLVPVFPQFDPFEAAQTEIYERSKYSWKNQEWAKCDGREEVKKSRKLKKRKGKKLREQWE